MQFKTISPTDPAYAKLEIDLSQLNDRFDYEGLSSYYGSIAISAIVQFPYPSGKMSVLSKNLEKRGLVRNVDFSLKSAKVGEGEAAENNVFLKRLTDKAPVAIVVKPRGRAAKKPAEGAATDGTAAAATDSTAAAAAPAAPAAAAPAATSKKK